MICPECKNEIACGARFCSNCGCDVELAKQAYSEGDNCDTLIVHGGKSQSLDGKFVIFDTETTGLDSEYDRLTQIAGLVFSDGRIYSSFDTMVDPERPIPEKITELTGIDDAMVEGAPSEAEALRRFLEFANGAVLVAHNANFHVGFLKAAAKRSNIELNCTFIDTLSLARALYQDLSGYSLNELAEHFGIGDCSNLSKAIADASKVHGIFALMIDDLKNKYNINDISEINSKLVGESAFDSFAPQPKKSGNWTEGKILVLILSIFVAIWVLVALIDSAGSPTRDSPNSSSRSSKSSSSSKSSGPPKKSDLEISDVKVHTDSVDTYCTGTIKNTGRATFKTVKVESSFKDDDFKNLETVRDYLDIGMELRPGQTKSFKIYCDSRRPRAKHCLVSVESVN